MLFKRVTINQLSKVAFSEGETVPSEYRGFECGHLESLQNRSLGL